MTIPFIPIQFNSLDILLAGLGVRLNHLSKMLDPNFVKATKDKYTVLQFTSDDGVARFFEFDNSQFHQSLGNHPTPHLSIFFKNSAQGTKLLTQANTVALMNAIQDGDVVITGDFRLTLWLIEVVKIAIRLPDTIKYNLDIAKPYLQKIKPYLNHIIKSLNI